MLTNISNLLQYVFRYVSIMLGQGNSPTAVNARPLYFFFLTFMTIFIIKFILGIINND